MQSPPQARVLELPFGELSQKQKSIFLNKWACLSALRISAARNCDPSPFRIAQLQGLPSDGSKVVPDEQEASITLAAESPSTRIEVITTFSEQSAALAQRGWSLASLPDPTTWVPSLDNESATSSKTWPTMAFITVRALYTRSQITLDLHELAPVKGFREAIEAALAHFEAQGTRQNILDTLTKWGHALPIQFEVGGVAYTTQRVWVSSMQDVLKKEEDSKANLMCELTKSHTPENPAPCSVSICLKGGDTLSLPDRRQWFESLRHSSNWEVIQVNASIPSVHLLEAPILEQLYTLTRIPLFRFPFRLSTKFTGTDIGGCVQSGPLTSKLDVTRNFTITAFFTWKEVKSTQWPCIFSTECPSNNTSVIWVGIDLGTSCVIALLISNDEHRRRLASSSTLHTGVWNHFALRQEIVDYQQTIAIYLNGKKENSFTVPRQLVSHPQMELMIGGGLYEGKRSNPWQGDIEGVKVFGEALQESEIRAEASSKTTWPLCITEA